jgi:hypothetical protein
MNNLQKLKQAFAEALSISIDEVNEDDILEMTSFTNVKQVLGKFNITFN